MKFLAIDYGTKRVGVAVSHEWLAEPLAVFDRATALEKITALIRTEQIETIVLGIADGKMADDARKFGESLKRAFPKLIVVEEDETLTSVETHAKLATSSMPRGKRQGPIDHYAAAAILQNYLDLRFSR